MMQCYFNTIEAAFGIICHRTDLFSIHKLILKMTSYN